MLTDLGTGLSAVIALATSMMAARYLIDPRTAAVGFGIPGKVAEIAGRQDEGRQPIARSSAVAAAAASTTT